MKEGSEVREQRKLGPDVWCYRWRYGFKNLKFDQQAPDACLLIEATYTQAVTTEKRAAQTAVVSLFVTQKKRTAARKAKSFEHH